MNLRIQELARQAGFENGHQDRNGNSLSYELEKFAELIIQECAGLNFRELGLSGSSSFDVGRMIKQHFGVEN